MAVDQSATRRLPIPPIATARERLSVYFDRFRPILISRAEREVGVQDASDVVQTTFASAWASRRDFDDASGYDGFARWITTLYSTAAANHWRQVYRTQRRQQRLDVDPDDLWAHDDCEALLDASRRVRMLTEAKRRLRYAHLTEEEMGVFFLRLAGRTYREIGRFLGITEHAGEQAQHRARKRLADVPAVLLDDEYRGDRSLPPGLRVSEAQFRFVISKVTVYHAPPRLGGRLAAEKLARLR